MIVESPTKARKIGSILGNEWVVKASMGHIVDLPSHELGVDPQTYSLSYVLSSRGTDVVASLRGLVRQAGEVYLATDPDREGEAIAAHLAVHLEIHRYQRVTFREITERGIRAALESPRQIDRNLVSAQEARRALDRLIGYRVSYPLSASAGLSLSAGRCQSPAVRLVVDRQINVDNHRPTGHFCASIEFEGGKWTAEWQTKPFLSPEHEYVLDRSLAERAASCRNVQVVNSSEATACTPPPAPFTTSSLLQAAGAVLGYSPSLTQTLAQKLFESGHITYHRTDNPNLSDDAVAAIQDFAKKQGWTVAALRRHWPAPQGAQEAHEAIRPTHVEVHLAGDDQEERALYGLIWMRAMASQLPDAEYSISTLDLTSLQDGQIFDFRARTSRLVSKGWQFLKTEETDDEDAEESSGDLPRLEPGTKILATNGKVLSHSTKPPQRYTETSLIRKLESLGIGRPSTFAAIVKHICDKHYVMIDKRQLTPTPAGTAVVDHLVGRFSFIDFEFTKELEQRLDLIAEGKTDYHTVVAALDRKLKEELDCLVRRRPDFPCPKCGQALRLISRKGRSFWGCSAYRQGCTVICEDNGGKPGAVVTRANKPSDKALAFARDIATQKGVTVPDGALCSSAELGAWIDRALDDRPVVRASPKQIELIQSLLSQGSAEPPKGWPSDVTAKAASAFIECNIKTGSGRRRRAQQAPSREARRRRETVNRSHQKSLLARASERGTEKK
ncbi:type I DNA topoisomerase [Mesorhizobium sp.]|uniref:type I DNA topoisomerase n=1 Tax=Mesorhizobium sp. TaxID=1871066 RepID=UPI0025D1BCFC|nr:type I DNA topoisomerase [Mesorhizobium sp.]